MAPDFFRSANLVYRRIPPTTTTTSSKDDDPLSPLFTTLTYDPSRINASPAIWDPPDGPSIARQMRGWATAGMLLSVYICLPCPADAPGALPDPACAPQPSSSKAAAPPAGPGQAQPASPAQAPAHAAPTHVIPLGIIHLSSTRPPSPVFGHLRKSRLGIVMAAEHQGKGYGGEALRWMTDWGFRFAGLHRIELSCGSWNRGAARLYERTGYVREGVRRRSEWCLGAWRDEWDFAMLEDEFWGLEWVERKAVLREGREGEDALVELLGCW